MNRFKTIPGVGLAEYVGYSATCEQLRGNYVVPAAKVREILFFYNLSPDLSLEELHRLEWFPHKKNFSFVDDGHPGTKFRDILHDMCGKNHHALLSQFTQKI